MKSMKEATRIIEIATPFYILLLLLDASFTLIKYRFHFRIPVVLTLILTLTARPVTLRDMNPAFHYGKAQVCLKHGKVHRGNTHLLCFGLMFTFFAFEKRC